MDEKQFKASYIAQFLASYMAQLYDKGHLRHLAPATYQPVEDAEYLADCAWESITRLRACPRSGLSHLFT